MKSNKPTVKKPVKLVKKCPKCTFFNDQRLSNCQMCNRILKDVKAKPTSDLIDLTVPTSPLIDLTVPTLKKICPTCTFHNDKTLNLCEVCSTDITNIVPTNPKTKSNPTPTNPSDIKISDPTIDPFISKTIKPKSNKCSTCDMKPTLEKYLENKKLQPIWTRGDGFCSIYAVMQSYLSTNEYIRTPNIKEYKNVIINHIKNNIEFYKEYEHVYIESLDELIRKLSLENMVESEETTIRSHLLFVILSNLLHINITVIKQNHRDKKVGDYYVQQLTCVTKEDATDEVVRKDIQSIKDIYIFNNETHYTSLIKYKPNGKDEKGVDTYEKYKDFSELPNNMKDWIIEMYKGLEEELIYSLDIFKISDI